MNTIMSSTADTPCLRVFVYGTLKRGGANHSLLNDAEFAGTGAAWGRLYDLGSFPALELSPIVKYADGSPDFAVDVARQVKTNTIPLGEALANPAGTWNRILGEVFLVFDQETLTRLDWLEGFHNRHDDLYTRTLVPMFTDTGPKPVWVYHMREPPKRHGKCMAPYPDAGGVFWPVLGINPIPPPETGHHRVFGYGSLLPEREIRHKDTAPEAIWRGKALLPGHRLALTRCSKDRKGGVADVVPDNQFAVWGGLYDINDQELGKLDKREGHPNAYQQQKLAVWADGQPEALTKALVYQVRNPASESIPANAAYKGLILDGARERGLPKAYIREIIEALPEAPQ